MEVDTRTPVHVRGKRIGGGVGVDSPALAFAIWQVAAQKILFITPYYAIVSPFLVEISIGITLVNWVLHLTL